MPPPKPVLISGAGLSGLLLARSLRSSNIPFMLFERDPSLAARAQGYRLRISTDGINALKAVLSNDEYAKLESGTAQTGQGGMHSLDAITGQPKPREMPGGGSGGHGKGKEGGAGSKGPGLGGDVLGVSRAFLRQCLFEGEEGVVRWGKKATGYSVSSTGVKISFADGSESEEGSLLIAADGPQSAITKQLTDGKVRAYDTGARMVHGQTPASAFKNLGEGVFFVDDSSVEGQSLGLITNVRPGSFDTPDLELGWVFVGSPGTFEPPNDDFSIVGATAANIVREKTAHWHPRLKAVFEQQNDAEAAFLKMSTAQPDGIPDWSNEPRVTVMGDAVHCMTPAGGVGANTALRDAALIGRLLGEKGGWWEGMTGEYEKEMRGYAGENVKMSYETAAGRFKFRELK